MRKSHLIIASAIFAVMILGLLLVDRTTDGSRPLPPRPALFDEASVLTPPTLTAQPRAPSSKDDEQNKTSAQQNKFTPLAPMLESQSPVSASPTIPTQNFPNGAYSLPIDGENIRGSQTRLSLIDETTSYADKLFSSPVAGEGSFTTNDEGLDQSDHDLEDGTQITEWTRSEDDGDATYIQAQEAQLPNGQIVDRWFNDDGSISQVAHQYDANNSFSIYYFDDGRTEATRAIRNGDEIFTRFDRDGNIIERTHTPRPTDEP